MSDASDLTPEMGHIKTEILMVLDLETFFVPYPLDALVVDSPSILPHDSADSGHFRITQLACTSEQRFDIALPMLHL